METENICPRCGSKNIRFENETKIVTQRRGCLSWLIWLTLAFLTFGLILIIPIITNSKVKSKNKIVRICQDCGHKWRMKTEIFGVSI